MSNMKQFQFQRTKVALAQNKNAIPLVWWTVPWFSMLIIAWTLLLPVYSFNQYYSRSSFNWPDESTFVLANVPPYLSYSYLYNNHNNNNNKNKNSNLLTPSPLNKLIPQKIQNHKLLITNEKKNVQEEKKEQQHLAKNGQKEDEQIMNPNEVLLNAAATDSWKPNGPMTKSKQEFKDYLGFFIPNTPRDQFDYLSLMDQLRNHFSMLFICICYLIAPFLLLSLLLSAGTWEKRLGNWNKLQSAWG